MVYCEDVPAATRAGVVSLEHGRPEPFMILKQRSSHWPWSERFLLMSEQHIDLFKLKCHDLVTYLATML